MERLETPVPDVTALAQVLDQWVTEIPHLVAQTVMRQTLQLRQDLQTALNQLRRDRARPLVEQLQWTAAATAFASPVPSLDLLATVAINGQLVMDLSQVYEQPLNLEQAKTAAGALAELVVKLGLVEASTQLLTTALKSHAATFVVGGTVQGLSAAYLTHMTGESLMAYFETRALRGEAAAPVSATAIAQALQGLVQKTQQSDFLKGLVQQGIQRFSSTPKPLPQGTTAALDLPAAAPVPMAQSEAVPSLESP
ncbi:MAG: YcjF family protein [Leptolyngbya sp. RL_3_1]|nr:YcjF family protein [Leptolyngbya sp. RL_3_1]